MALFCAFPSNTKLFPAPGEILKTAAQIRIINQHRTGVGSSRLKGETDIGQPGARGNLPSGQAVPLVAIVGYIILGVPGLGSADEIAVPVIVNNLNEKYKPGNARTDPLPRPPT
jgi:hypothetical protein